MAFESHVFENGQWVTRTTNINDLINKTTTRPTRERQHAPQCGIMTRTVVHSPVAHWILSVRLRSSQHNDIAFIGDHYVQISELRRDGQLHNITRKCDFGSRIRNARVIGTSPVKLGFEQYATTTFHGKADDGELDMDMSDAPTPNSSPGALQLPPQLLLIVLETGDCVFLFLRPGQDGSVEFVAMQHSLPSSRLVRPGFHLAVDPSSRYVAQACSSSMFVVHELDSMDNLNFGFARGRPLQPIISSRPRHVNGVIHTIEFLYPRPQDPQHIILLLIVVNNGVTRMITYDWELGDDLRQVFSEEKSGHILPPQHEMPLMIIPLTVRSAFFAVSEDEIAYCADVLQGSPSFEPCEVNRFPPSAHHEGTDPPLWTAWSRPPRLYPYNRDRDFIYMAREDGVVIFLECDTDDILGASIYHGTFCNVSTAFASLADDASSGEILVFGGDSGQGGVWSAVPRGPVTKLCRIPNWSPTVDFVTTTESNRWDNFDGATGKTTTKEVGQDGRPALSSLFQTDKIYAAAGRGINGSIVEYRRGLQANIGIEFDFGTVIKRCFMFQENASDPSSGYHLLLSVPGKSALLYFDSDFSTTSARDIDQGQTPYDLSSPTLIATPVDEGIILQVTESSVVFATTSARSQFSFASLGLENAVVTDAALARDFLAVISHTGSKFQLHVIKLNIETLQVELLYTIPFNQGEVTAFSLCEIAEKIYAVTCLALGKAVFLDVYCITHQERITSVSLNDFIENIDTLEPLTSVVYIVDNNSGKDVLVAGSRDGLLLTFSMSGFQFQKGSVYIERMGSMPAHVYPTRNPGSVFICCDSSFVLADNFREGEGFTQKRSVWTVDADDSSRASPTITSVRALQKSLSGNEANMPLLLLGNDHFFLAELQSQEGSVQRHIPLGMTPLKLLYSHVLKCLVVAVRTPDGKPTLRFIDPGTGDDLSIPLNGQTKEPVEFINGLGIPDDRILSLEEWHVSVESGHSYYYILVATHGGEDGGRVLIISPKPDRPRPGESRGKIRFWTRHKIKPSQEDSKGPVYAVTASGRKIEASMGTKLLDLRLDEGERKITQVSSHELGAPAWKLSLLPKSLRTMALVKGESIRILEGDEADHELSVTHIEPSSRPALDMLEVAGDWASSTSAPVLSEPPNSIVLVSDQNCSLAGLWVPWDTPGRDCEVLFEADLPSSVRRLHLGRTLPAWSRDKRKEKKFGLLTASVNDAEILGMGIDGSIQHFTLLDLSIWRFLRFIQNVADTSAELYPFTHIEFEEEEEEDEFDPTPELGRTLEMQVDGDLMQRCLEKRALENLIQKRGEWIGMFVGYLDGVDGGRWTREFKEQMDDGKEKRRRYFELAYEILEYFLVPVI